MSQHIVQEGPYKWVFGWDPMLQSFYLSKYDMDLDEEEQNLVWLGADPKTTMYEVEKLVYAAHKHGLKIEHEMQIKLYGEKDDGV